MTTRKLNDDGCRAVWFSEESVTTFYIYASGWKEICGTYNAKKTADLCREKGWLMPGDDGKNSRAVRLPEVGLKRVYVMNSDVIGLSVTVKGRFLLIGNAYQNKGSRTSYIF